MAQILHKYLKIEIENVIVLKTLSGANYYKE